MRFNGAYTGSSKTNYYFHFDSWRVNTGPELIGSPLSSTAKKSDVHYALTKTLMFKAQTRLWGYNLGHGPRGAGVEQGSGRVRRRRSRIRPTTANDFSPLQAQRAVGSTGGGQCR